MPLRKSSALNSKIFNKITNYEIANHLEIKKIRKKLNGCLPLLYYVLAIKK